MPKASAEKAAGALCESVAVDAQAGRPAEEDRSAVRAPEPAEQSGPLVRRRAALLGLGVAVTVGVSAAVAAIVASAIASGGREEQTASVTASTLAARRLEPSANRTFPHADFCLDTVEGEMCHRLVTWIMEDGVRFDAAKYANLTRHTPFHELQAAAHALHPDLCPRPCGKRPTEAGLAAESAHEFINCDYGHEDPTPAHAGCFVVHNGRLLAERLTYDGEKYDIPGGQTNWREPARCTAYRETFEETGYLVAPRELIKVVRNDFHVYRCELLRPEPLKGHDHEIAWVGWLGAGEISSKEAERMWRFPESRMYASWLR
mmetsp:Transcript_56241/g.163049  ORF Transcript_56241/g.163049 Transcript_56241/m.163049 type:complete len:318 (-) Transcript_56241:239-1192(-)